MADDARDPATDRDGAARCVIAIRRMMQEAIAAEIVLNPALDMLLALYLERDRADPLERNEVCATTGVSAEICRHWGLALAKKGLIAIEDDRYRLTAEGRHVMEHVNDRVWSLMHHHLSTGTG